MFRISFLALAVLACFATAAAADGDPARGAQVYKRCAICHTDNKGGADGLGPNLFGVMGRKAASRPGFSYSPALKGANITWTEASMSKWVEKPGRMVPGTKMAFAGITSKRQRADLIAFLQKLK
jgi:cytochrome c